MSKPFQFSIRRMLLAVALACLGVRLSVLMVAVERGSWGQLFLYLGVFVAGGAAAGVIRGRLFDGAVWGFSVGIAVPAVLLLYNLITSH